MAARLIGPAIAVSLFVIPGATPTFAQGPPEETASRRPLLLVDVRHGVPIGAAAGVGVLIPLGPPDVEDRGVLSYRGILAEAQLGQDGWRLASGLARRIKDSRGPVVFGGDVLLAVSRTDADPPAGRSNSTFLAAEAGILIIFVRVGIGAAHRVAGAPGPDGTIFTWSLGVQTGW